MNNMKTFRHLTTLLLLTGILFSIESIAGNRLSQSPNRTELPENPSDSLRLSQISLKRASAQKNYPAVVRHIIECCEYQLLIATDSLPVLIKLVDTQARTCPEAACQSLLYSYEAELLNRYYDNNRYTIRQRETVADTHTDDIREWDTDRFIYIISDRLEASLKDEKTLFTTPLSRYANALKQGADATVLQPTLYDFLSHQAINLYKSLIERYPSLRVQNEVFTRASLILPPPFPDMADNYAIRRRIIDVYDRLIDLWNTEPQSPSLLMARLDRETFLQEQAPDSTYIDNLFSLYREYEASPYSTEVLIRIGETITDKDPHLSSWLSACEKQMNRYADYFRIGCLANLYKRITAPIFYTSIPQIVYPGINTPFDFTYSHIDRLVMSIAPTIDSTSVKRYEIPVISTRIGESQEGKDTLPPLPSGNYRLYFEIDGTTGTYAETTFAVSKFYTYTQNRLHNGGVNIVVTDGYDGKPQSHCEVRLYTTVPRYSDNYVYEKSAYTDSDGILFVNNPDIRGFRPVAENDSLYPITRITVGNKENIPTEGDDIQTVFFTDRSVYRPGDTLRLAGVIFSREISGSKAIAGEEQNITLYGVNGKIAERQVKSDNYGVFTDYFVLPEEITGYIRLEGYNGSQSAQIAEYKKATFQISIDHNRTPYFSGNPIILSGHVTGYAGDAIAHATVNFSIKETSYRFGRSENQTITGSSVSDSDGNFLLTFVPRPSTEKPSYRMYQAEFSVTAANGETQTVRQWFGVSDNPIHMELDLPNIHDKKQPLTLPATITAAPNAPKLNNRTYEIYALQAPEKTNITNNFGSDSNYDTLKIARKMASGHFKAEKTISLKVKKWESGLYRIVAKATTDTGIADSISRYVILYGNDDKRPPVPSALWIPRKEIYVKPGEKASISCGTSFEDVSLLCQLFDKGMEKKCYRLNVDNKNIEIEIPYEKNYGPSLTLALSFVKENRLYASEIIIRRKSPDTKLMIIPQTFRDHLVSGTSERWKFKIKDSRGKAVQARLIATMYDQALDAIAPLYWNFYPGYTPVPYFFYTHSPHNNYLSARTPDADDCPPFDLDRFNTFYLHRDIIPMYGNGIAPRNLLAKTSPVLAEAKAETSTDQAETENSMPLADLRRDFRETAFFYSTLESDKKGIVEIPFSLPDSHTSWKLMLAAITEDMQNGFYMDTIIASKPLMINPNLPRFVRTGDKVSISTRISNTTRNGYSGLFTFEIFDPENDSILYRTEHPFKTDAGKTQSITNTFTAEEWNIPAIGIRLQAMAEDGTSDGEQHLLPILPYRVFLTEAASPKKKGGNRYGIEMKKLADTSHGEENFRATLSYAPSPLWFVLQALPGLTEQVDDNSTPSLLAAFYGNTLAEAIVLKNPMFVAAIQAQRQKNDTLPSPLTQNETLKMLLLEETPWVLTARNENKRITQLAELLDRAKCVKMQYRALTKLLALQNDDGGFPWKKGMGSNIEQTLSVLECYAQLYTQNLLGDNESLVRLRSEAINFLNKKIAGDTARIAQTEKLSNSQLRYLVLQTILATPLSETEEAGRTMLCEKAEKGWKSFDLEGKALTAQLLYRTGNQEAARRIVNSLLGYATITDEEIWWQNIRSNRNTLGDIRLHTLLMNTVALVTPHNAQLAGMAAWLLQQKETRDWGSIPATLDAVSALISHSTLTLDASSEPIKIIWGKDTIAPESSDIDGYTQIIKEKTDITPDLGTVSITTENNGLKPWIGLYRQYFVDADKIESQGNGLSIEKRFYVIRGDSLLSLSETTPEVGDKIQTRLIIASDRDLDFVAIKDNRPACLEPAEQQSRMMFREGLSYFQETRDAATRFYIEHLPKGHYILRYETFVDRPGRYLDGGVSIQSLYAPQETAHSGGIVLDIPAKSTNF